MAAVAVQSAPNDPRPADDPTLELIALLRTKSYYLPNLSLQFKEWPDAISPHYPLLKISLDARINEYVTINASLEQTNRISLWLGCIPPKEQQTLSREIMAYARPYGGPVQRWKGLKLAPSGLSGCSLGTTRLIDLPRTCS